jgi:hypothetical protein
MRSKLERVGAALGKVNPFPQTGAAAVSGPEPKNTEYLTQGN